MVPVNVPPYGLEMRKANALARSEHCVLELQASKTYAVGNYEGHGDGSKVKCQNHKVWGCTWVSATQATLCR